ncbi:Glutarate-semialdehyde dehydrogenase DavD [Nymphon striatum]|nr:Glutarate-semialdehyde dehydrogenase DavD [Nymphon striatum]
MTLELKNPALLRNAVPVGNRWIKADSNGIAVTNPATGKVIGHVPDLGAQETQEAIKAAQAAQKTWAARTAKDRSNALRPLGKPLAEAAGEIGYGASFIEWFSEEARRAYGDITPGHAPDKRILTVKQPIGVVAAITPWNFPNAMIARKAAPAFAAGCAMVLKPSELTPFSAIAMAILAQEAGIPAGLFSVLTGDAQTIGKVITDSPIVRKLTFTGSTGVGAKLYAQCAPTIKKLGLELGGNAPFIVFDDADLDAAAEGALISKFRNNGQTCVCANRIYVQAGVYDAFAEKLATKVAALKTGNGFDQDVFFGPLINDRALRKVQAHIDDAKAKGATVILGGKPHQMGGTFFEPTILTGVKSDMAVATEETFGPVAPLFKFETEAGRRTGRQ